MSYTEEWTNAKCDKYDYLISAFSGIASGMIDIFFVGTPEKSVLSKWTDTQMDNMVKKFAKMFGWRQHEGKENSIASAIGFLERKFAINYDQANMTQVGGYFEMGTKNHHYKSLSHSPDVVGLFFSILDQFQHKSSFLSDGKLIRIETSSQDLTLYGHNLLAKLFCGFCNWIGHIMSDIAGSSGGRGNMTGRGSGISIPFMELFQLCDFGELQVGKNRQTFAVIMTEVFQKGYDVRFCTAMSIPVIVNELIIRTMWIVKKHFYDKKSWKECVPTDKHSDLRMMLLIGYGALCIIDGADSAIRSGGNLLAFILRLNFIAWVRFIILVFKELRIRYGDKVLKALITFIKNIKSILSANEYQLINEYYERMKYLDEQLAQIFNEYVEMVNREYMLIHKEIEASFNNEYGSKEQSEHSIALAKNCNVDDKEIICSKEDLDKFFLN